MKLVHVKVALFLKEDADVDEVIANMDYDFTFEDKIIMTEIVDVIDPDEYDPDE